MENLFSECKGLIAFHHPMAAHTSYKVGGPARVYAEPETLEALVQILEIAETNQIETFLLGRGSNLLVSDDGFNGLVINLARCCQTLTRDVNRIYAGAGVSLDAFLQFCCKHGLSGLEDLSGIPGSVGGALKMNAGAFDVTIFDRVLTVDTLNEHRRRVVLARNEIEVAYRKVPTLVGRVILGATFDLTETSPEDVTNKRRGILDRRLAKQPLEYPSCGSVFKRPVGHYVGKLIETAGCKGLVIGGAEVSEKHANFILNKNKASAQDIYQLIQLVKKRVYEAHGVALETEVIPVGFKEF